MELKTGRANPANKDTRFISQEAEWFLAGVLDGIADGTSFLGSSRLESKLTIYYSDARRTQLIFTGVYKPFMSFTFRSWFQQSMVTSASSAGKRSGRQMQ